MSPDAELFGQALKRWRQKRGVTQEDLAHEAGITASYCGQVERGLRVPSLTIILKLCRALDCTPSELLAEFTPAVLKRLRLE
jgi:transcriptional regulator with XRE-family HTH domain